MLWPVTRGAPSRPTVALTFDDGPNGACTAEVLDALAETGAKATFFVLGHNAKRGANGALLARMVREGHEVAVHGWRHDGPRMFVPFVLFYAWAARYERHPEEHGLFSAELASEKV